jgi:outer membrane lipoprotein-sorting protein
MKLLSLIFSLVAASFVFSSCAGLTDRIPEKSADHLEAVNLLSSLNTKNQNLKAFKGVGRIKLWGKNNPRIDERVAWAGSNPSSLLIVVLVSGHPAIKFSTDGNFLYFLDLTTKPPSFKKISSTDANLDRLVSIPIRSRDVVSLLSGRIPIHDFTSAGLKKNKIKKGYIIVLKKRWRGVIEKIYLDENMSDIQKVEIFKSDGSLMYRAVFQRMKQIKGYYVPLKLVISNDDGTGFMLDIERYLADVTVSPSLFVLSPPEK